MKGKLILEDGSVFHGEIFGEADTIAEGEVVFNTGMTGYQEILTDPSYCRQIVTLTYPMIGNYGTAKIFNQSRRSFVSGLVIGEMCEKASNFTVERSLADYLTDEKIPCLYNVDTRAVTKKIRSAGTMKGVIVNEDTAQSVIEELMARPVAKDVVAQVTISEPYTIDIDNENAPFIVAMDFGVKQHILDSLHNLGCKITVVPANTSAESILAMNPDGIFLSNGPGDPKDVPEIIAEIGKLLDKKPIFGICLGHQLLALAMGADTYKLKFGHRGSNQPVQNLKTGRIYITSQNHGYAVDESSLEHLPLEITYRSANDGTVEGMRHKELPIYSVQYHPEASPGPTDNMYLFDEFIALMKSNQFI